MNLLPARAAATCAAASAAVWAGAAGAQSERLASAAAGRQVYDRHCAICHDGGDETAPVLGALRDLDQDRVAVALEGDGVMSVQAQMLTEAQRREVIAFLSAPSDVLARLDAAAGSAASAAEDLPDFGYPPRRIRAQRDSPRLPRPPAWPAPELGEGPFEVETWEQRHLRVVVVARGLTAPRAIEFLPGGDILIAERAGALRIVRDGALDPEPVAGTPEVAVLGTATGFMDVALHPDFEENGWIYLSYHKPAYGELGVNAILRGRWDGEAIAEGEDIFVSDDVDALYSRLAFGPDGKLYATIGNPGVGTDESLMRAQDPADYAGTTLRLNDDGSVPDDNPFVGREGYNPEVFTYGHRVNLGLTLNPWTNELWVSEHGPQGGDEINILRAGRNYGWPVLSDGRYYAGPKVSETPYAEGMTRPHISYVPSIAPGGLIFYAGDKFPAWEGDLFVGAMRLGSTPRTGHLQRIVFNEDWEVVRREMLLFELHQRIRDVEQGPDGYLWVVTDEGADSVLMRLEPGEAPVEAAE